MGSLFCAQFIYYTAISLKTSTPTSVGSSYIRKCIRLSAPVLPSVRLSISISRSLRASPRDPNDRPTAKALQKHPYLRLPFGWTFDLSQIQHPRHLSLLRGSYTSSHASDSELLVPQRLSPISPSSLVPFISSDVAEDQGPPIIYITPPSSPLPNTPLTATQETREGSITSNTSKGGRGYRIANPDPDPDPEQAPFVYTPPPLPDLGTDSSGPASPSSFDASGDAYPRPDRVPVSDSETSRSVWRGSSTSGWSGSDDTYSYWQKPPAKLTTIALPPSSIPNLQNRNNRLSGAYNRRLSGRPHPTEVYDNLEEYFPGFDFDQMVTTVTCEDSSNAERKGGRMSRIIRKVVEEQSNRASSSRRTTKLWDCKVEELGRNGMG